MLGDSVATGVNVRLPACEGMFIGLHHETSDLAGLSVGEKSTCNLLSSAQHLSYFNAISS